MRILIMTIICVNLFAQDAIIPPKDWKHASGNDHNFDVWAVGVNQDALWHVDLKSGNINVVGKLGVDIVTAGLSFDHKGTLYMLYSKRERGLKRNVYLSTVDTKTGRSTLVKSFPKIIDSTIGFEISKNGKHFYWSNRSRLHELNVENGTYNHIMDIPDGTWCLANAPGGKMYGVSLKTRNLLIIDPNKKTYEVSKNISIASQIPALAVTPGGRLYCDDFSGKVYSIQDDYILLGQINDSCHGFAIINSPKAD